MPVAKVLGASTLDTMKIDEGTDSLDTFIRQAVGKEPLFSLSRTGDNPVQWIQFLHQLDQQGMHLYTYCPNLAGYNCGNVK